MQPAMNNDRVQDPSSEYAPSQPKSDAAENQEKTRVIFVPWEENTPQAEEWKDKSEQWNAKKNDKFDIVYYKPGQTHEALLRATKDPAGSVYIRGHGGPGAQGLVTKMGDKWEALPMADVCQRLVEMGLGADFAGSIKFHSCYSGTVFTDQQYEARQQTANEAAARTNKAIKNVAQGAISRLIKGTDPVRAAEVNAMKRYAEQRELLRPVTTSIAKQGAETLRDNGFTHCKYYGYLGPVESKYAMDTNSAKPEEWHKMVDLEGLREPAPNLLRKLIDRDVRDVTNIKQVRASVARVRIR
jgi:hypothetical protein